MLTMFHLFKRRCHLIAENRFAEESLRAIYRQKRKVLICPKGFMAPVNQVNMSILFLAFTFRVYFSVFKKRASVSFRIVLCIKATSIPRILK